MWVEDLKNTYFGDANLDGEFNSGDFVQVFQRGHYEDTVVGNSGWADGDWNGDGEFDSGDFVLAFQSGGYELGSRAASAISPSNMAAVPEPTGRIIAILALFSLSVFRPGNARKRLWSMHLGRSHRQTGTEATSAKLQGGRYRFNWWRRYWGVHVMTVRAIENLSCSQLMTCVIKANGRDDHSGRVLSELRGWSTKCVFF